MAVDSAFTAVVYDPPARPGPAAVARLEADLHRGRDLDRAARRTAQARADHRALLLAQHLLLTRELAVVEAQLRDLAHG